MDALQALLSRMSPARLAPDELEPLELDQILAAGLRAADHGYLPRSSLADATTRSGSKPNLS